jgi:nitrogen regulatory protein P-II 1
MYKIAAMLRRDRVDSVKKALVQQGFEGIVVADLQGYGWQTGAAVSNRRVTFEVPVTHQAQVELSVPDTSVDLAIDCIAEAVGEPGCAAIFVTSLADADGINPGSASVPQPRSSLRPRRAVTAEANQAIGKPRVLGVVRS